MLVVGYLFKLCLLFAVLFQSSPVRLCGVEKVMTGQNCHEQQPVSDSGDSALIHCNDVGRAPSTSDGEVPACMPCQSKSPVDRQVDGPRPDLAVATAPLVLFSLPVRAPFSVVRVPHLQAAVVGRTLPLLI
jgi:hypothetical protein